MANAIWKDNIKLIFKGFRKCWSYRVLKLAFESNITKFNPDNTYYSQDVLAAICTFTFNENTVKMFINTLYEERDSIYIGICPKTAPSNGYAICKYIDWTGIPGSVCLLALIQIRAFSGVTTKRQSPDSLLSHAKIILLMMLL